MYPTAGPRPTFQVLWSRFYGSGKLKAPVACDSCRHKKRRCQVANLDQPACTTCCLAGKRCRCCLTCTKSNSQCVWKFPALTEAADSPFAMQDLEIRSTERPKKRRRDDNRDYGLSDDMPEMLLGRAHNVSPSVSLSAGQSATDSPSNPTGVYVGCSNNLFDFQSTMERVAHDSWGQAASSMRYVDGDEVYSTQCEAPCDKLDLAFNNAPIRPIRRHLSPSRGNATPWPPMIDAIGVTQVNTLFTMPARLYFPAESFNLPIDLFDMDKVEKQAHVDGQCRDEWEIIDQPRNYRDHGIDRSNRKYADLACPDFTPDATLPPERAGIHHMPDAALYHLFDEFSDSPSDFSNGPLESFLSLSEESVT